jgi:hypothetical protein
MICLHRQRSGHRSSIPKCGCAGAILLSMTAAARAMTIVWQDSIAPAGGTGSFDVDCFGDSQPSLLYGFLLEIIVPAGITITSADVDTADPYIFGALQSPPFVQSMTSDSVEVADSYVGYSNSTIVSDGDAFGLAHIDYSVAPGTLAGPYFVNYPTESLVFSFGDISFQVGNTITVTVPEPVTMGMLPLGGMALLGRRGRRG